MSQNLGLSNANFSINRKEWLYKINIANLNEVNLPKKLDVVSAKEVSKDLLIRWMQASDQTILKQLVIHLKNNIIRPIAGILGSNI
ncbi:MAG: hypothetical protein ACR2HS_01525, partial [Gammaproteobacteria bacterium]